MKKLIVTSGLPGSGKSTLAESLAKKLSVPIFSVDPIESAIIKSGIKKNYETGLVAYIVAETLASENLGLGLSVVIDAVNAVKEARDMWRKLAEKYNARLYTLNAYLIRKFIKKELKPEFVIFMVFLK